MTAVEVLTRAKEILMEKPWGKGAHRNQKGELCMAGAHLEAYAGRCLKGMEFLDYAMRMGECNPEQFSYLNRAATRLFPERGERTASVNDHPETTFQDVMAVFDDAILLAKEAEAAAHVKETA